VFLLAVSSHVYESPPLCYLHHSCFFPYSGNFLGRVGSWCTDVCPFYCVVIYKHYPSSCVIWYLHQVYKPVSIPYLFFVVDDVSKSIFCVSPLIGCIIQVATYTTKPHMSGVGIGIYFLIQSLQDNNLAGRYQSERHAQYQPTAMSDMAYNLHHKDQ
jgi:hypothetical protein